MNGFLRGLAYSTIAILGLSVVPEAKAMLPVAGMMCDTYLNIRSDSQGRIINSWISYENCTPVDATSSGGDGDRGTSVDGVTPRTDCGSNTCCACKKAVAVKWAKCKMDCRWTLIPAAKVVCLYQCANNAAQNVLGCSSDVGSPCS